VADELAGWANGWLGTSHASPQRPNHPKLSHPELSHAQHWIEKPMINVRGVRGATTSDENSREAILQATRQLLALMIRLNGIESRDVASAIFTTTVDLDAEFPALAARQLGWLDVPLLCTHEIDVPGSLRSCVRVLVHWNTHKTQPEIKHVYLKRAVQLRPDLSDLPPVDMEELETWIAHQMMDVERPS
jgi:chorismate mutase